MNTLNLLSYIDPMSGAIALQLIIAFFVAAGTFFRQTIFGGMMQFFRPSNKEEDN